MKPPVDRTNHMGGDTGGEVLPEGESVPEGEVLPEGEMVPEGETVPEGEEQPAETSEEGNDVALGGLQKESNFLPGI